MAQSLSVRPNQSDLGQTMYICICNALKDKELAAASTNARTVADVFRRCGARPQCGKCLADVAQIIEDVRAQENDTLPLAAE
jgi:bacterioferritin-associated ferredoxin